MPYKASQRLPGERASKLGHLDVINSPLVKRLVSQLDRPTLSPISSDLEWHPFERDPDPLQVIFAVDGSLQPIRSDSPPFRELAFVKTALFRMDRTALAALDQTAPHPLALRDIMADSALYHATAFPLRNLSLPGLSNYHAVRQIIFESLKDDALQQEPMKTLRWLAYEKWTGKPRLSPSFECPHCGVETDGLSYDQEKGPCRQCGSEVYLSDMLGFHLEMNEEGAPPSVASAYMLIHETLLLFTGIRHFWESRKFELLRRCLFIKDGPLSLRGQYVKLVDPIRNFFQFARDRGVTVHMVGQEKSGIFFDHLQAQAPFLESPSFALPSNEYIRREVQQRPERGEAYGYRTNYGNKVFVKTDEHHFLVLSAPTGHYVDSSAPQEFVGLRKILGSLFPIMSHRHEGALLPVELAHGVASLSTYPSARILKVFADI